MSRGSKLTITGLYEFNPDVFKDFKVPDGMDRQMVIESIVMECSAFSLIYPSFTFMQMAIKNWTATEFDIWDKLYESEKLDYNPLWNVDATVVEDIDGTGIGSTKGYNETRWLDNAKTVNNDKRTTRRTGNIGVTSSQQLLKEQREVADFSTVYYIINSFKKRFCVMIY